MDNDYDELNNETTAYDYDLESETEKAVLMKINGESVWLPKSQIDYDNKYVWIPFWLADEKGLI